MLSKSNFYFFSHWNEFLDCVIGVCMNSIALADIHCCSVMLAIQRHLKTRPNFDWGRRVPTNKQKFAYWMFESVCQSCMTFSFVRDQFVFPNVTYTILYKLAAIYRFIAVVFVNGL